MIIECIPFNSFKEKILIVKKELNKKRYVEVWEGFVYSANESPI